MDMIKAIKTDIASVTSLEPLISYSLLDDGTLAVFEHEESGNIRRVNAVNVSIGRTLTKAEWGNP
jgi:hypothetical protein